MDRLVESKGLDFVDGEKAKYDARRQLEERESLASAPLYALAILVCGSSTSLDCLLLL